MKMGKEWILYNIVKEVADMIILVLLSVPILTRLVFLIVVNFYNKQKNKCNTSSVVAVKKVLNKYGLINTVMVNYNDEDCFNPANNTITLSQTHNQNSISSVAIAMHEVGHALQFNEGWWLYKFRCYIVSLKNAFIYVSAVGIGLRLVVNKYIIFTMVCIFCLLVCILVELYVEIDASKRACKIYRAMFETDEYEMRKFKFLLSVAAFTYVIDIIDCALAIIYILLNTAGKKEAE